MGPRHDPAGRLCRRSLDFQRRLHDSDELEVRRPPRPGVEVVDEKRDGSREMTSFVVMPSAILNARSQSNPRMGTGETHPITLSRTVVLREAIHIQSGSKR